MFKIYHRYCIHIFM